MASKITSKPTFEQCRAIEPFYTGGEIIANYSGSLIASTIDDEDCLIVDLKTAIPLCRIDGDGEAITSLCLTPEADFVVVCSRSLSMRIFHLSHVDEKTSAELSRTLKPHATPVVSSTADATGSLIVTGGADGTVKVWDIRGGYCSHTFHSHGGLVTALHLFESQPRSVDGKITSSKRGKPGPAHTNAPNAGKALLLASSGEDGRIKVHNLNTRQQVATLESHTSVVRSLTYSADQELLLSAGRDRTIVLWDVKTWSVKQTLAASEELEAAGFLPTGQHLYAGGEQGRVRVWSFSGQELETAAGRGLETEAITSIIQVPCQYSLLAVRGNQTLELLSYQSLDQRIQQGGEALASERLFSGNHDEVIDMACIGDTLLAIADNTETPKILSTSASNESTAESRLGSNVDTLEGHTDVVICMDVDSHGRWLATGSKDNTARIWCRDRDTSKFKCLASLAGHTASIGAIGLQKAAGTYQSPTFLITGSEDKTVKKWDLSALKERELGEPHAIAKATFTRVAHEKDINAVDTSPILPIFASASQDRTIKIWSTEDGSTAAILKGHKRGVWSVQFSPAGTPALNLAEGGSSGNRGLLISGSGDNTVKVWSLNTYACLLTLEGHQNSVLKVLWLPPPNSEPSADLRAERNSVKPMIASASSDTLIKIWSPYASEDSDHLLTTLDGHTDRVWSLATPLSISTATEASQKDNNKTLQYSLISGGADAKIAFWTDTTATTAVETSKAMTQRVEQDQLLQNYILAKNYKEVITLSLALNHPGRLLKVFEDVVNLPESERAANTLMGVQAVDDVLAGLNQEQIYKLLERVRDWNTNVRTATVAQKVLNCLLRKYPQSMWADMARDRDILKLARSTSRAKGNTSSNGVKDLFRALEAYTDRHYRRLEELIDETYLLEYTLREMDEIAGTVATTNGVRESEDVTMV